jgi:nitric oxide reductase NorE protein
VTTAAGARLHSSRRLPGEEGLWVFIFGDMTVFAVMFGVYLYYRGRDTELFAESQTHLNQGVGVANTLILLTSSLLVVTAVRAVRAGAGDLAMRLVVGALICGGAFIANKAFEYTQKVSHNLVPTTNEFFMYFYVLTGLHLAHVILGMGLLAFLVYLTRQGELSKRQSGYVDGVACFWHMVDLLWVVIFPLLYLVH